MSLDERDLRERCLALAVKNNSLAPVEDAARFYAFITGESDLSPRERIEAALEDAGVR